MRERDWSGVVTLDKMKQMERLVRVKCRMSFHVSGFVSGFSIAALMIPVASLWPGGKISTQFSSSESSTSR